jgi:ferredoxin-type protein NapH
MTAQQLHAAVVGDAAQLSRLRGRIQIWLLLLVPAVIVGGWWYPYLGFLVPVVMVMGMVGGLFRGRWVCGWACPRGSFLERIMRRLSFHLGIPHFLRNYVLRWALFGVLMGFMVWRLSLNPGDPEHWGRVFWLMCTITTSVGVILAVLFWPRTWCAFCPVGTCAGTVGGRKRPLQIEAGCRECRACEAACPLALPIVKYKDAGELGENDCLRCGACVAACPFDILHF